MDDNFRKIAFCGAGGDGVPVRHPVHSPWRIEFGMADEPDEEPDPRNDELIKLTVMTALQWDLAVPRDRVKVRVSRGWATLSGQVRRADERSCAEADARMTPGVAGVINKIECKPEG